MTDAVEKMAYAGETPWHGQGNKVANNLTPAQMLKAASLDWTVSKTPLYFADKAGKMIKVENKFGLIRDSDEALLTVVGDTWKPVQNEVAMDFFKKFVVAGKMTMETAGALWGGRYIWALARVGKDFSLGKGSKSDEIRSYLLLSSPHVHGKALVAMFTPIRVVCWNTLTMALGSDLKGKGGFHMPHSTEFTDAVKKQAEQALGLAEGQMEQFETVTKVLSAKKAPAEKVDEYFMEVLKFDPKKATKKKDGEVKVPRMLPKFQAALTHAPGQQMPSALGTWWGALNAVTYVIDHETGRDRGTALRNAWLGHTANIKRRALDLAMDAAK